MGKKNRAAKETSRNQLGEGLMIYIWFILILFRSILGGWCTEAFWAFARSAGPKMDLGSVLELTISPFHMSNTCQIRIRRTKTGFLGVDFFLWGRDELYNLYFGIRRWDPCHVPSIRTVIDVNGLSAVTLWPICEKLFMMITALQRLRVKLVHIYGQSPTALPIIHSWAKESQNFGRLCRVTV